jgi:transcriptional regulator with XRE-family HTH domain
MITFNQDFTDMFLGVVRKYMQLRGGLSQKDLAEKINTGISTMSRFLNQKTKEIDPQLIASIVAYLNIPLHEIIDFIAEDSTQTFKKLVGFYKGGFATDEEEETDQEAPDEMQSFEDGLGETQTRKKTSANIKGVKMVFGENQGNSNKGAEPITIRDKLNTLSPRQKGFLTDFLDLDMEGRDLIVDIGNAMFRYFKQGSAEF